MSIKKLLLPIWKLLPLNVRRVLIWIPTPKFIVGVGVVCQCEGKILLLKHKYHNEFPWGLPTGWIAKGENPYSAINREFFEETGKSIHSIQLLDVDTNKSWFEVYFQAKCHSLELSLQTEEIEDYRWISVNEVRDYKLLPRQEKAIEAFSSK